MKQEELPTKVDVRVTKLEYFAGEALRGLLANPNPNLKSEMMVELAMVYAEGMMKEFEKLEKNDENFRRIYGAPPKKDDR
jgi:hypothetical protein